MRRAALLLAAPVLAAGLLAGCDLPGGSPKILGPDQVPNNEPSEAPAVRVPGVINGTVDQNDRWDYFDLSLPSPSDAVQALEITCTGNVEVALIQYGTAMAAADGVGADVVDLCDGQPHVLSNLDSSASRAVLEVSFQLSDPQLVPYLVTTRWVDAPTG